MELDEEDRAIAARLLSERSAEDIAATLVHFQRAMLPQPEELLASDNAPAPRSPREGFEGSAWFRLNVGRSQNADARWILPLLCRRGHVTRGDIGAIRLAANETLFEVRQAAAERFLAAVSRTAQDEDDGAEIVPADGPPRDTGRHQRRDNAQAGPQGGGGGGGKPYRSGPRQSHDGSRPPKPHRKGPPRDGGTPPPKKPGKKGAWHKKPGAKR